MSVGAIVGNVTSVSVVSVSITPAQSNAVTAVAQTFTVPGAKVGDAVIVNPVSNATNISVGGAYVSAANTVSVQFVNPTAGALTAPAGVYKFIILRTEGGTLGAVAK